MNTQALANAILQLLPRVSIPMTPENAQNTQAIYETLGAMSRGELILLRPSECGPDADHSED